ncbi:hypothetical protein GF324_02000, partial [bacterium]|nr:hypothetical protein [bacterium]
MAGFNPVHLILLIAAVQGFFLTVFIFYKHGHHTPNRLFGALNGLYTVILAYLLAGDLDLFAGHREWIGFIIGLTLLFPPLHYLYMRCLLRPERRFSLRTAAHFLPFLLFELFLVLDMIRSNRSQPGEMFEMQGGVAVFNWLVLLYGLIYMAMTLYHLYFREGRRRARLSNPDRVRYGWLKFLTWITVALLLVYFVENLFLLQGIALSHEFSLSSVTVAVFVYAVGYLSLFRPEIYQIPPSQTAEPAESSKAVDEAPLGMDAGIVATSGQHEEMRRYAKSGLSEDRADEIEQNLRSAME